MPYSSDGFGESDGLDEMVLAPGGAQTAFAGEPTASGQPTERWIVETVGARLDIGIVCQPLVRDFDMGRNFRQELLRDETHHGQQGLRNSTAIDQIVGLVVVLV
jgi:hypothetical protein